MHALLFAANALVATASVAHATPDTLELEAHAGGPYEVTAGDEVVLDGSASVTFQCEQTEFGWDLDGDRVVDIDGGDSATARLSTADIDGPTSFRVTLYVICWLPGSVTSTQTSDSTGLTIDNAAPVITALSADPATVQEGSSVRLDVAWTDPEPADTHVVTWELEDGTTLSGDEVVASMPQDGDVEVRVTVQDDDGGEDSDTLWVRVDNAPPELVGTPPARALVGQTWRFAPMVSDPGADDLHLFSAELPPGALLEPTTGEITWVPTAPQLGDWEMSLTVEDDDGATDYLFFTVEVVDGGSTDPRPGQPSAGGDPWAGAYDIQGEGCACSSASAGRRASGWALLLLALLPGRRRRR